MSPFQCQHPPHVAPISPVCLRRHWSSSVVWLWRTVLTHQSPKKYRKRQLYSVGQLSHRCLSWGRPSLWQQWWCCHLPGWRCWWGWLVTQWPWRVSWLPVKRELRRGQCCSSSQMKIQYVVAGLWQVWHDSNVGWVWRVATTTRAWVREDSCHGYKSRQFLPVSSQHLTYDCGQSKLGRPVE